MSRQMEREAIKGVYRNPTWSRKVNAMGDDQVYAIYRAFKAQKKL